MQAYTELVPPTGVTSALSLPFTSPTSNDLVVARTSVLQVFSLKTSEDGSNTKLVLASEYHVAGTITALSRVKILDSRSGGEAILIAVRDAKLSLIEWNPELHSISTVSIHYYESEDLQKNPWAPHISQCATHLTVDPSSRCAAFNFGVQNLAILPFHQLGDDLVMEDYDAELNGGKPEVAKVSDGNATEYSTPYASSFVLSLTTLDPNILHPIDLAFLYEYREPTFGILYTTSARSQALSSERKDVTYYAVFTLDLEQKASTTLLSISKLPNDLYRVIPLPPPVSGALLIGSNELIHVDQGGKTNALGVNEFARQCSSFSMTDSSNLNIRLEGSQLVALGPNSTDLLLILSTGDFLLITFKIDGRTVSGLQLSPLDQDHPVLKTAASCAILVNQDLLFLGSEDTDSILLGFSKSAGQLKRQSSRAVLQASTGTASNGVENADEVDGTDDDDEFDEDLYGPEGEDQKQRTRSVDAGVPHSFAFNVQDSLLNIGPIRDVVFGTGPSEKATKPEDGSRSDEAGLELMITSGSGSAGGISILKRELEVEVLTSTELNGANGLWSFSVKGRDQVFQNDKFLIVSMGDDSSGEKSDLYRISAGGIEILKDTEFESSAGGTIAVGSIAGGSRVVQALQGELRSYDSSFGLSQIHPIIDEDAGAVAKAVHVSFLDPYVLVIREDNTITLLNADKSGDLEECDLPENLSQAQWTNGCLYDDQNGAFGGGATVFLLGSEGSLHVISASNLTSSVFFSSGLKFLPARLNSEPLPKHWRQQATIKEILVTDLGDLTSTRPYMLLKTTTDEVVIYEANQTWSSLEDKPATVTFSKISNHEVPRSVIDTASDALNGHTVQRSKPMVSITGHDGLRLVYVPGSSPSVIAKTSVSSPKLYHLRLKSLESLAPFNTESCPGGFVFINDAGQLQTACLDRTLNLGILPWAVSKKNIGFETSNASFFPRTGTYVLACNEIVNFQLPQDDEWHPEWENEQIAMAPQIERSSLKVLSRKSWKIIDTWQFDPPERVMCLKTLNLETSDETHERKDLLVVGTAITKGEDIPARGSIYIFDIVDVVPEPGIDGTDLKLKLIAREDVKGAVTALSHVGSQGFVMAAQGQKTMVRGLKEDGTILPVAFLDMNYYVNVIKELKGTGLCILGDACHGLWFTGYSEEPYKLQVYGRDLDNPEVMAADFLPINKQLYIVTADGDCDVHVFQYDPENPTSSRGTELLRRSTFHTGYFPSTLSLVPRTPVSSELAAVSGSADDMALDLDIAEHQLLLTTQEGALALITPLTERAYRRLSTLQNLLTTSLDHPCGLNPRAHRSVETDGIGGRGIIDGDLVSRWLDQSSQHQASLADKIGATVWDIRGDLEAIGGAGIGYL